MEEKMNEIKVFENPEFGKVRTIVIDEKPYFAGSDVATALGYQNPSRDVQRHCKNVIKRRGTDSVGRQNEMSFISEFDVYRLIMRSNLPSAERFQDWVVEEVLPSIRKHGAYMTQDTLNKAIGDPDFAIGLLTALKEEQEKVKQLNSEIEKNRPATLTGKAIESSANGILIGQYVPILREAGWEIGTNRLFEELRSDRFLCSQKGQLRNKPTQFCLKNEYMKYRTNIHTNSKDKQQISYTPLVTGKGQIYFLNYYKKKYGF